MPKKRKADPNTAEIDLGYLVPDTAVCPFLDKPLEIVHSETLGQWCARGDFWYTRWFSSRQELMHWLHWRAGKAPKFPARVKIVMVDGPERRERDQQVRLATEEDRMREQAVRDYTNEQVERMKRK